MPASSSLSYSESLLSPFVLPLFQWPPPRFFFSAALAALNAACSNLFASSNARIISGDSCSPCPTSCFTVSPSRPSAPASNVSFSPFFKSFNRWCSGRKNFGREEVLPGRNLVATVTAKSCFFLGFSAGAATPLSAPAVVRLPSRVCVVVVCVSLWGQCFID